MHFIWLGVGMAILAAGAEILVRGGSSLARRLGLTPLVIGLTVVAMGTSAPEMVVSVGGSIQGHDAIAVGNVIGSNIFNLGFILGICALVFPITIRLQILRVDAPLLVAVSLGAAYLVTLGSVSRWAGAVMLVLLAGYTWWSVVKARGQAGPEVEREFDEAVSSSMRLWILDVSCIVAGLGLLALGAQLLVGSASALARTWGLSEAIIGLTIVAAGTSMPELATSFVAALRRQTDMAIGNVLGSNLFNLLGILGLSAVCKPLRTSSMEVTDIVAMLGLTLLMVPLLWTGRKLQRWEGAALLSGYAAYLWMRWP